MPTGSKDKYSEKQKRQAEHIEKGYEKKGMSEEKAEGIAWATVNKDSGGGDKEGGSGKETSAGEKKKRRSSTAKTAAQTRKTGKRQNPSTVGKKLSSSSQTIKPKPAAKQSAAKKPAQKKPAAKKVAAAKPAAKKPPAKKSTGAKSTASSKAK